MQKTRRDRKNLLGEEWLPVPGYEGAYEVSNMGRVKSLKRYKRGKGGALYSVPERLLNPSRTKGGRTVCLSLNGTKKTFYVHELVALLFVEGLTVEKCVVRHKDGNVENDAASNLEWVGRFPGIARGSVVLVEEWRPVPGYEGIYEISNLGRVKNLERQKRNRGRTWLIPERILNPSRANKGHTVCLSVNGEKKTFWVHNLVAMAFVEGRTAEKCVVHRKDGNIENDDASNLEWVERFYSIRQKDVQWRIRETRRKNGTWRRAPRPVELVHDGEVVARYSHSIEAAEHENISATTIRGQCRGSKSRRPGYQWRYAETKEVE